MHVRNARRKIRFSLVSSIATGIDFSLLLFLTSFGMATITANYISSSISFIFSFFANKKFAFRTPDHHIKREAVLFIIVTLTGIWLLQPLIIWKIEDTFGQSVYPTWLVVIIAKIVASFVTFIWNYYFYTRLVFKKKK
jgi:putative flippase GtrA